MKRSIRSGRRIASFRGWKRVGEAGSKQACLDYIDETWTDMRPLSLRTQA